MTKPLVTIFLAALWIGGTQGIAKPIVMDFEIPDGADVTHVVAGSEEDVATAAQMVGQRVQEYADEQPGSVIKFLDLSDGRSEDRQSPEAEVLRQLPGAEQVYADLPEGIESQYVQVAESAKPRVIYSIIRGAATSAGMITVIASQDPSALVSAIPIITLAGAFSSTLQFNNRAYLKWIGKGGLWSTYLKDGGVIFSFMALLHGGMFALGIAPELVSGEVAQNLATASAASLYAKSSWLAVNAGATEEKISQDPARTAHYNDRSALYTMLLAMGNTTLQILEVAMVPGVKMAMGVVGTAGVIAYSLRGPIGAKLRSKLARIMSFSRRRKQSEAQCSSALSPLASSEI